MKYDVYNTDGVKLMTIEGHQPYIDTTWINKALGFLRFGDKQVYAVPVQHDEAND